MIANKVFCPLCGFYLDCLPSNLSNPSWKLRYLYCGCGGLVIVTHIESDARNGLDVKAFCNPDDAPPREEGDKVFDSSNDDPLFFVGGW